MERSGILEKLVLSYKNDKGLCPNCNEKLKYEEEWDRLFDSYDVNTPQMIMVVQRLYNEDVPKYTCSNCTASIYVRP